MSLRKVHKGVTFEMMLKGFNKKKLKEMGFDSLHKKSDVCLKIVLCIKLNYLEKSIGLITFFLERGSERY